MTADPGNDNPKWSADSPGFPIVPVLIFLAILVGLGALVVFGLPRLTRSLPTRIIVTSTSPPVVKQKPSCNSEATALTAVNPDYPESAMMLGLGPVTTMIQMYVGPDGKIRKTSVLRSSGNAAIDQAAMTAARQSTYTPKMVRCHPVGGTYIFRADFDIR